MSLISLLKKICGRHLDKFEIPVLLCFLFFISQQGKSLEETARLVLFIAGSLIIFLYFASTLFPPAIPNPNAVFTYRISRLAMIIGMLAILGYAAQMAFYPLLLTLSSLGLALLPMKSQMVDRQRPPRAEIIRISVWLLLLSALFYAFYSAKGD